MVAIFIDSCFAQKHMASSKYGSICVSLEVHRFISRKKIFVSITYKTYENKCCISQMNEYDIKYAAYSLA